MSLGCDRLLTVSEFFKRAQERLTFNVPAGFADPHVIPAYDARGKLIPK